MNSAWFGNDAGWNYVQNIALTSVLEHSYSILVLHANYVETALLHIKNKRANLNAQEIGDDRERAAQWKRYDRNPVFDQEEVRRMVKEGVRRLTEMQLSDGGWGWFSGRGERSSAHTTAHVVHGLQIAVKNDVAVVKSKPASE